MTAYPIPPYPLTFSILTGWYEAPIPYAVGEDDGVPIAADFDGWTVEGGLYSGEELILDMAAYAPLVLNVMNIAVPADAVEDMDVGQYTLALRFVPPTGPKLPALAAVVVVTNP